MESVRPAQRLWALFSNAQIPLGALPYVGYFRGGPATPGAISAQFPRGRLDPWTPLRQAGPRRQMKGARLHGIDREPGGTRTPLAY